MSSEELYGATFRGYLSRNFIHGDTFRGRGGYLARVDMPQDYKKRLQNVARRRRIKHSSKAASEISIRIKFHNQKVMVDTLVSICCCIGVSSYYLLMHSCTTTRKSATSIRFQEESLVDKRNILECSLTLNQHNGSHDL